MISRAKGTSLTTRTSRLLRVIVGAPGMSSSDTAGHPAGRGPAAPVDLVPIVQHSDRKTQTLLLRSQDSLGAGRPRKLMLTSPVVKVIIYYSWFGYKTL